MIILPKLKHREEQKMQHNSETHINMQKLIKIDRWWCGRYKITVGSVSDCMLLDMH